MRCRGGEGRLLLVQDNAVVGAVFCDMLERADFDVDRASDGRAVLARLDDGRRIDLTILDLDLHDAAAIAASIRSGRGGMPFVALGGRTAAARGLAASFDAPCEPIPKPVSPSALMRAVRERIARLRDEDDPVPELDRAVLDAWLDCMRPDRAARALASFEVQLTSASTLLAVGTCTRRAALDAAHGLIGSAGTLGFMRLHRASLEVQALREDRDNGWAQALAELGRHLRAAVDRLEVGAAAA